MDRIRWVLVLAALAIPAAARADPVIATGTLSAGWSLTGGSVVPGSPGEFFVQFPFRSDNPAPELFNFAFDVNNTGALGQTFRATADSDPDFDDAVRILTNGVQNIIGAGIRYDDGQFVTSVFTETDFLGRPFDAAAPDLRGFAITAMELTLNRFTATENASSRFNDWRATVRIEGAPAAQTPEPASLLLFVSGAAGLLARRRRAV